MAGQLKESIHMKELANKNYSDRIILLSDEDGNNDDDEDDEDDIFNAKDSRRMELSSLQYSNNKSHSSNKISPKSMRLTEIDLNDEVDHKGSNAAQNSSIKEKFRSMQTNKDTALLRVYKFLLINLTSFLNVLDILTHSKFLYILLN
jgi:hypothetical protein